MSVTLSVEKSSSSDDTVAQMREVLNGRRRGLRAIAPFAGPAVVVSVAYMDPGNFATNIQAGAGYGYGLLWIVVAASLVAMLFQFLSAKLGLVTGLNLAEVSFLASFESRVGGPAGQVRAQARRSGHLTRVG